MPTDKMCPAIKTSQGALGRARFGGRFDSSPGGISGAAARLGTISAAEKLIAHTGSERTYCHMDKKVYGLSDLAVYGRA